MEHMDDLQGLRKLLEETQELIAPSGCSTAQINVSAGGAGVWISAFCAALCFVMLLAFGLALGFVYLEHNRKIERMQDHLNAIYMMAPHLKPKDEE